MMDQPRRAALGWRPLVVPASREDVVDYDTATTARRRASLLGECASQEASMAGLTSDQVQPALRRGLPPRRGCARPGARHRPGARRVRRPSSIGSPTRLAARGQDRPDVRRAAVRGPLHRGRGGLAGADDPELRDRPPEWRLHGRDAPQLRPRHVQLPAQPADPRPHRVADRRRDLLQPRPAHADQAAAVGPSREPLGQPHRPHAVAPGPGRRARRGRQHPDDHGLGGHDRRRRDRTAA